MNQKLMEQNCTDFVNALAAKQSVPGGGGAAAYVGALGIALGEMTGNFTAGKKKYAAFEEDIRHMLRQGKAIRMHLLELIDKDAESFLPLSKAYSIPKENPDREEILEACTKEALQAPLAMMKEICKAIELLEEMSIKGSRLLISDVGCGSALSYAALQAAALNVFINTSSLKNRDFAEKINSDCQQMLDKYLPRAQTITNSVFTTIQS